MRVRIILGEVLPVLGTIGLLGLWTFQQIEIEERAAELRKLGSARAMYQTYQSNNALFNAIRKAVGKNKETTNQIRIFQLFNLELGLQEIEKSLPSAEKTDIPTSRSAFDSSISIDEKMSLTQKRIEKLKDRLTKREAAISLASTAAKKIYLWLYIGMSIMMIIGAIMKALDKLYSKYH